MASDLENNIHEFVHIHAHLTNKKIFLQFEAKPLVKSSTSESASNSRTVSKSSALNCIVDVLMNKTNSFPEIKQNASFGAAKQYNTIVNYVIVQRFCVNAGFLTDFEKLC